MNTHTFDDGVLRGAALLDKKCPGWISRINLTRLDLISADHCVLGQVYGSFRLGLDATNIATMEPWKYGFMCWPWNEPKLNSAWREYITARRTEELKAQLMSEPERLIQEIEMARAAHRNGNTISS